MKKLLIMLVAALQLSTVNAFSARAEETGGETFSGDSLMMTEETDSTIPAGSEEMTFSDAVTRLQDEELDSERGMAGTTIDFVNIASSEQLAKVQGNIVNGNIRTGSNIIGEGAFESCGGVCINVMNSAPFVAMNTSFTANITFINPGSM